MYEGMAASQRLLCEVKINDVFFPFGGNTRVWFQLHVLVLNVHFFFGCCCSSGNSFLGRVLIKRSTSLPCESRGNSRGLVILAQEAFFTQNPCLV